jgi:hypothetical protein
MMRGQRPVDEPIFDDSPGQCVALRILIPLTDLGAPRDPECPEFVDHILNLAHRNGRFSGHLVRHALATKLAKGSGVVIQITSNK